MTTSHSSMNTKACCRCGQDLPADAEHFTRDAKKPEGIANRCRECARLASRRWKVSGKGKTSSLKWRQSAKGRAYALIAKERRKERAVALRPEKV